MVIADAVVLVVAPPHITSPVGAGGWVPHGQVLGGASAAASGGATVASCTDAASQGFGTASGSPLASVACAPSTSPCSPSTIEPSPTARLNGP